MKELRKFGFSLAIALNILGCIMFYRENPYFIWFTIAGSLNLASAVICPKILIPVKKILDFVILGIGHLVNIISLTAVFYLILTPIGILFRIFRKDILGQKIDKAAESYWVKRNIAPFSAKFYERMG